MTGNITTSAQTIIGTESHPFCGNFDGGAREGITITNGITPDGDVFVGLFGYIGSGSNIHDVKTAGSISGGRVGGIIYAIKYGASNVTISNCTNGIAINTTYNCGGIIGKIESNTSNITVRGCVNDATITSTSSDVAGIIGSVADNVQTIIITECENKRAIVGTSFLGGIVGVCGTETPTTSKIYKCKNNGTITSTYSSAYCVGGIVGRVKKNFLIDKCANYSTVYANGSSSQDIGGIAGDINDATIVRNSYNCGEVKTDFGQGYYIYHGIGGLVGGVNGSSGKICYVDNCYNIGKITASSATKFNVGGIVGYLTYGYVRNCYNGYNIYNSNVTYGNEYCYQYAGNIVGSATTGGGVQHCHFRENMISYGESTRVAGSADGAIENCYKFSHTSESSDVCTLNGSTKPKQSGGTDLTFNSSTYGGHSDLVGALNYWRTNISGNSSLYTEWIADASPWENRGMPKFFACTPITINTFDVTSSSGQNTLTWTASGSASSYTIYWECPSSVISSVGSSPYTHTGLTGGNTYCYEVMAVGSGDNCAENTHSERICRTVPTCTPVTVSNFQVTEESDRQVKLTWDMISGATYKLYYGINNPPSDGWVTPQNVTSPYTVPRLTNGVEYHFAIKPTGTGDYCTDNPLSSTVSATPVCNE